MKKILFYTLLIIVLISPISTMSISGNVTTIVDGDTIKLSDNSKIRLIGIDAPDKSECYYKKSKNQLSSLIKNKKAKLVYDEDKYDAYGRQLAYVYNKNKFINRLMVLKGYASVFTVAPNDKKENVLLKAQDTAQFHKRGIWGHCDGFMDNEAPIVSASPTGINFTSSVTVSLNSDDGDATIYYSTDNINFSEYSTDLTFTETTTLYFYATDKFNNSSETKYETYTKNASLDCYCDSDSYNCSDFTTQTAAQSLYDCCMIKVGYDVHRLDGDDNGLACESLK